MVDLRVPPLPVGNEGFELRVARVRGGGGGDLDRGAAEQRGGRGKGEFGQRHAAMLRRLAFRRGFRVVVRGARGSSKLGGTLQVPRGRVSCHGVWERMRGKRPKGGEARKWRVKGGNLQVGGGTKRESVTDENRVFFSFFLSSLCFFFSLSLYLF